MGALMKRSYSLSLSLRGLGSLLLLASWPAIAEAQESLRMQTDAAYPKGQINVLGGIDRGGVALGGDYSYSEAPNEAFGAYVRFFQKDKSEGEAGLFGAGAHFKGGMKLGLFEYYLAPGFGVIHHNFNRQKLLIGPSLALGVTAEVDKNWAIGIENMKLYSWAGEYKGIIKDAFLANVKINVD